MDGARPMAGVGHHTPAGRPTHEAISRPLLHIDRTTNREASRDPWRFALGAALSEHSSIEREGVGWLRNRHYLPLRRRLSGIHRRRRRSRRTKGNAAAHSDSRILTLRWARLPCDTSFALWAFNQLVGLLFSSVPFPTEVHLSFQKSSSSFFLFFFAGKKNLRLHLPLWGWRQVSW